MKKWWKKLQYNINRKLTKVLVTLSRNIDKYEYLTGTKILPLDQNSMLKRSKFTYSSLEKAFKKQKNTIEKHGKRQVLPNQCIKSLYSFQNQLPLVTFFLFLEKAKSWNYK